MILYDMNDFSCIPYLGQGCLWHIILFFVKNPALLMDYQRLILFQRVSIIEGVKTKCNGLLHLLPRCSTGVTIFRKSFTFQSFHDMQTER